ncbi:hypothetical protein IBE11_00825 [Francisella tularensis subsp. novicida]|uniref:hypothetical protein n=1 Tax=Francisella tularensis TaxID=263 RepID=UPI000158AC4F|nr:hypothetical protein [Francisella tularensis]AJI44683.1 virB/Tra/Trw family protein [Francisella tularensis subsp. novicida F6168]AJJ47423.1 hypothetical protein CH70_1503 [Francisella tularensis subsp. novicida]APC98556.1 hypothetical protein KX03_564 [Francisella tularensis subsp. novicida]EDN35903.1 conserved hypothetical protein [Francisella tularensis subsp. novicida GA99-3549]KFJ67396.1 virB/Tra/Trw family protein [Francisella tularensis subsp. novicida]
MKKIFKISSSLVLLAGISACSSSDMDLQLTATPAGVRFNSLIQANIADIKGFIGVPNDNATPFNYTVTGDFADLTKCRVLITTTTGALISGTSKGTTYNGQIIIDCEISGMSGPYSGTVSMSTSSGGNNYSGSIPLTIS